jgi:L-histidine N-alpha-methyltransferase
LNLLTRINRELGGDFDLDRFAHVAFYSEAEGRVELYLKSLAEQTVMAAGQRFRFGAGELIHTENSYKYAIDEFRALAAVAGFEPIHSWTDRHQLFSVHYLRRRD